MSRQSRPRSADTLLRNLNDMAKTFNRQAAFKEAEDRYVAEMLNAAARALREEKRKNEVLQKELDALKAHRKDITV